MRNRAAEKLTKCLALAADERGDPTTRETARRQAEALRRSLEPAATDWTQRTSSEAAAAGLEKMVLCRDGYYVPSR